MPHSKASIKCNGYIVSEQNAEQVTLKCNLCGAVVGTINGAILNALEQAIADQIVVTKFDKMDAPEAFTSISEECQREECDRCPGFFNRPEAGDQGGQTVFCVHSCHQVERHLKSIS